MLNTLRNSCESLIKTNKERYNQNLIDREFTSFDEKLFCDYQIKLVSDKSPVLVCEKGRQIGYSYVTAFRAVWKAANNKRDTVYMSYNRESSKDFMKEVHRWCRIFNLGYSLYEEKCIEDGLINIFDCRFSNLRQILAVSGDCTNLRGKPGADIIIDECAYNDSGVSALLAASMATLIHGGSVRIGSTHAGIDNDFNKLIESVKKKELPYSHIKISFRDAIKDGLYRRICAKKKEIWTQEKEDAWVTEIYDMYGIRASEELDAIPSDYSESGKIFNNFKFFNLYEYLNNNSYRWHNGVISFRYSDLAASKDPDDLNASACYSASVQISMILETGLLVITDWTAEKVSPLEGDDMIERLAIEDGSKSVQIIEQEPGSTGLKYVAIMEQRLIKKGIFQVFGYRPTMEKVKRAIPAGNAIQKGELVIDSNLRDKDEFCKLLGKFSNKPQPLITDLADCVSGAYLFIKDEYNFMLS